MIEQAHTSDRPPELPVGRRSESETVARGKAVAINAAQQIAGEFSDLGRHELLRIVTAFRRELIPPKRPGRRRSKEISAAHADWKSGIRGLPLYRKHIASFDQMSRWKRQGKSRALMEAIRSRERRTRIPHSVRPA
jgi:hypothetical protein